ncbi:MAG TPA: carbon starvation CstA family protein [Nitrososphaera sp.]|jgi:carbon starvation protein CstA|nr:carbon starvation CstA family protein [Nitrososphaera sp.]
MGGSRQRINGEMIAGIALVFLASLFIWAASAIPVWAIILPADYLILAIGIGFIVIGALAVRRTNSADAHTEHSSHY